MTDEVVRLKAEVRELQEAVRGAKPGQVRTPRNAKRERDLVQYLEGLRRGNDQ